MKLYLAGTYSRPEIEHLPVTIPYLLESFYYIASAPWLIRYIKRTKGFLLDSGAFTFMSKQASGTRGKVDFDSYTDRYVDFIKAHDIRQFFELDIDVVVGYEKVKELRRRIERGTGKRVIPVWHKSRGLDEFDGMCKDYHYVAIGGIVSGEIPKRQFPYLRRLVRRAHDHGAAVHGLGFTPTSGIEEHGFDSVDSKSWLGGSMGNTVFYFKNGRLKRQNAKAGQKRAYYKKVDAQNIKAWVEYANYLDRRMV